jgi:hypothetical protein
MYFDIGICGTEKGCRLEDVAAKRGLAEQNNDGGMSKAVRKGRGSGVRDEGHQV